MSKKNILEFWGSFVLLKIWWSRLIWEKKTNYESDSDSSNNNSIESSDKIKIKKKPIKVIIIQI